MGSTAYDLIYSNSIGGEHATTVDGNGRNPGRKELLAVTKRVGLDGMKAKKIAFSRKMWYHSKEVIGLKCIEEGVYHAYQRIC